MRGLETMDAGQQQKEQLGSSSKQTVWVHLPSRPVYAWNNYVVSQAALRQMEPGWAATPDNKIVQGAPPDRSF